MWGGVGRQCVRRCVPPDSPPPPGPTLLGILPYAGTSFAVFEGLKSWAVKTYGSDGGTLGHVAAGGAAGLVGQITTYPLDTIRRRMQTEGFTPIHAHTGGGAPATPRHTMLSTGRRVLAEEGVAGLYKGVSMNAVKGPCGVGLSFATYGLLKRSMGIEQ